MNVINILGTICDMIGGFLIARYLENDMKKEISAEIKKYETRTNWREKQTLLWDTTKKLKLGGYYDSRAYYWNNLCYINFKICTQEERGSGNIEKWIHTYYP